MILDDNLVFTDDKTPATGASEPVALTSFHNPGKVNDLYIMLRVTAAITGATSIDVKLQQSDTKNGSYTDVPGFGITLSQDDGDFDAGAVKGYYAFPPTLTKQWMKLYYTVTGSVTAGKLFAAITPFRDIPYESGEYIDAGKVVG